jgi:hypothetical protein
MGLVAAGLILARDASAFEFYEGRLQIHGFYEAQIRAIQDDFAPPEDMDLTQWWNVLNVEVEADLAPDGIGPLDLVSMFSRIEVRYDCVWTRACALFPSANAYGDRSSRNGERIPQRVASARRSGFTGDTFTGDTRKYRGVRRDRLSFNRASVSGDTGDGPRVISNFFDVPGFTGLVTEEGPDNIFGTGDDPPDYYFSKLLDDHRCFFAFQKQKGANAGVGNRILPWDPNCKIRSIGRLHDKVSPLSGSEFNPIIADTPQMGFVDYSAVEPDVAGAFFSANGRELPFRPAPPKASTAKFNQKQAQGVYVPNSKLVKLLDDHDITSYDQNFRQEELAWNRGASQQDEKELKEFYFDVEAFDSQLWMRVGKQSIVWGKTELFRTTDQFNPVDLALASLPSLEESRIALWAARGVWSFYDVGPLDDVRFELAFNFDDYEPTDLGRCGEPYTPLPVCDKTTGLLVHGLTGAALAGEVKPPDPWNDLEGLEGGARLEFRWSRFSFALSNFYGYSDSGFLDQVFRYSRNVDPLTGRPRRNMEDGDCTTGDPSVEPDCLGPDEDALRNHHANQQIFAMICASSIGFNSLDFTACGQGIFNSQVTAIPGVTVAGFVANLMAGNPNAIPAFEAQFLDGTDFPAVSLNINPCDIENSVDCVTLDEKTPSGLGLQILPGEDGFFPTLNNALTDQQEALLGCGRFYGTNCDEDGFDLMNAEASALMQSFPGFTGTADRNLKGRTGTQNPGTADGWRSDDASVAQPGTVGFLGGAVCTRPISKKRFVILPGCRGPADAGWDPSVDGSSRAGNGHADAGIRFYIPGSPAPFTQIDFSQVAVTADLVHPFTGQVFANEMAAVSWNLLILASSLSGRVDTDNDGDAEDPDGSAIGLNSFDVANPYRLDGCSYVKPYLCSSVQSLFDVSGITRASVKAGGNGRFGRRDFVWLGGSDGVLRYDKRNVFGISADFAEDVTKSNWGMEFTWIENIHFTNNDDISGQSFADTYNLTISVDRPTFVNFLNANRTLFINSQWFFQYINGWDDGFSSNGPFNILGTFTVTTGYFQDRLLPAVTFVYDKNSNSGAVLPQITYRFTENFSTSFGLALFSGRFQDKHAPVTSSSVLGNRTGRGYDSSFVENALSPVRERDEAFLRIKYTF